MRKKSNGDWNHDTLTWNNKPSVDSTVSDYFATSSSTMSSWNEWDITGMAKQWYDSDNKNINNGVEISTLLPEDHSVIRYISADNTTYPNDKPQFVVNYRNFIGSEPYWSYTRRSVGYKGIGKVNNYAGTLSISENILSYSGARNPLSIKNTYNNATYNEHSNTHVQEEKIYWWILPLGVHGFGVEFGF